jgi:hypothetical protein
VTGAWRQRLWGHALPNSAAHADARASVMLCKGHAARAGANVRRKGNENGSDLISYVEHTIAAGGTV